MLKGDNPNHDRYVVPGLMKGLGLLELFNHRRRAMTLTELAHGPGIARSSAFRLAYTLETMGFLERNERTRSYRLGTRVLALGFEYLASTELVDIARPELERLRDRTQASAHLCVRENRDIIYLLRVTSLTRWTSAYSVGERRPAHASPMGRILLAGLAPEAVRKLYAGATLDRWTDQTATTVDELLAKVAADRSRGYVVSRGSLEPGGASVAAPVFDHDGAIVAAIDISGPEQVFDMAALDLSLKDAVLDAAAAISQRVGFTPGRGVRETGPQPRRPGAS